MKNAISIILFISVFFMFFADSGLAQKRGEYLVVVSDMANVHSGPGKDFGTAFRSKKGQVLELIEKKDNWFKVKSLSTFKIGWIFSNLTSSPSLETEILIYEELFYVVTAQQGAEASMMSPKATQLPIEVGIYFLNRGNSLMTLELLGKETILTNKRGESYDPGTMQWTMVNGKKMIARPINLVKTIQPNGHEQFILSFYPEKPDEIVFLNTKIRGPVKNKLKIPDNSVSHCLIPVSIPFKSLPSWSEYF